MSFTNRFAHEMDSVCAEVEELKRNIEVFYASDAPHEDKMKVFVEAPDFLKNHASYIQHSPVKAIDEMWLDGDCRGALDMVGALEGLEENLQYYEDNPVEDEYTPKYTREDIRKVEEWVLKENLGSYGYDW